MPMPTESWSPRCMLVAEVAQAQDGSMGMAHAYVDAIAIAGADTVKLQNRGAPTGVRRVYRWT